MSNTRKNTSLMVFYYRLSVIVLLSLMITKTKVLSQTSRAITRDNVQTLRIDLTTTKSDIIKLFGKPDEEDNSDNYSLWTYYYETEGKGRTILQLYLDNQNLTDYLYIKNTFLSGPTDPSLINKQNLEGLNVENLVQLFGQPTTLNINTNSKIISEQWLYNSKPLQMTVYVDAKTDTVLHYYYQTKDFHFDSRDR